MFESVALVLGAILIYGPIVVWLSCRQSGAQKSKPPDFAGLVLAIISPIFIVVLALLLDSSQRPGLAVSSALLVQALVWRRVLRGTQCAQRLARFLRRAG
ncbi:MAG: hypothetical protein RI907_3477 [Pseudomonadota bacterium]|jgi:hypothetical protein